MKISSLFFCLAVLFGFCSLNRPVAAQTPTPTPFPISDIFDNKGDADLSLVRNAAFAQSHESGVPFYKSNGLETRIYESYFKPASDNSKLALLSDDGTSVWIDGVQVLNRAGQGQGFEHFDSTFTPLSASFQVGRVYRLRLQYTNTSHTSDADVDGLTIFAYDGGGEIIDLQLALTNSSPNFVVFRHAQEDIEEPSAPQITASTDNDASNPDSNAQGDDSAEDITYDANLPDPSLWDSSEDDMRLDVPTANNSVEHPKIQFGVRVKGYQTWSAEVSVYSIAEKDAVLGAPLARVTTDQTEVSWDELFPDSKPDSGVYSYNIKLQGTFDKLVEPAPEQILGLSGDGKDTERLAQDILVKNLQIEWIDEETNPVPIAITANRSNSSLAAKSAHKAGKSGQSFEPKSSAKQGKVAASASLSALTTASDAPRVRFKFQMVKPDGSSATAENLSVSVVNSHFLPDGFVTAELQEGWYVGELTLGTDEANLGDIILVADGNKPGATTTKRPAVAAKAQVNNLPQITGIAIGFDYYQRQPTGTDWPSAPMPSGRRADAGANNNSVRFYTFLKIFHGNKTKWYGEWAMNNLSNLQWIGSNTSVNGAWTGHEKPTAVVPHLRWMQNALTVQVEWRRYGNEIIKQRPGTYRWYGLVPRETIPGGLQLLRAVNLGTEWWGAKIAWKGRQPGKNGKKRIGTLIYLLPTNRKGGQQLFLIKDSNSEYHGNTLVSGTGRFKWGTLTLSNGIHPNLLTPDPSQTERDWNGRISGRNTLGAITFEDGDTFFSGTEAEKAAARAAQGIFNAKVLNEAYAFVGAPYSWGGHNYGGRQSVSENDYTLSEDYRGDSEKPDSVSTPGNSQTRVGYGIDCNGLIIEGLRLGGLSNRGDMGAGTMASRNDDAAMPLIRDPRYLRAGDIMAWTGAHVVFLRSAPNTQWDAVNEKYIITGNAATLEARPDPSDRGPGRVVADTRHGDYLRDKGAVYRRWMRP